MVKEAFGRHSGIARRDKMLAEKAAVCKCQHACQSEEMQEFEIVYEEV